MTNSTMTDDGTGARVRPDTELEPRDLLETARRAVRRIRSAHGLPAWATAAVEDLVADVVDACLTAHDHGAVVTVRDVRRMVHRLIHREGSPDPAEVRGVRRLTQAIAEFEQRHGCTATPAQVDQLATQIVEGWGQPSHRPARSGL